MRRYDSFLLRIWCRDGKNGKEWAGRLEHVQDGQSLRFTTPEALLSYLQGIVGGAAGGPTDLEAPLDTDGK